MAIYWPTPGFKGERKIDYLGYIIDTTGTLPVIKAQNARVTRIKRQILAVLKQSSASARVIAKVARLRVSVAWAVTPVKLLVQIFLNQVVLEWYSIFE